MKLKILTVIVPAFNMEALIQRCLNSLVVDSSLMKCYEVLVINDGSTDKTGDLARQFVLRYPTTFKVIDKANGHYGSCINRGLEEASGQYVKILDADDYFDQKAFAEYLKFLLQFDSSELGCAQVPDMVWNDFVFVNENCRCIKTLRRGPSGFGLINIDDNRVRLEGQYMHQVAYRTSLLRDAGYRQMEGVCYTDNQWCHEPVAYVRTVAYTPVVLYNYLVGRQGQSVSLASWKKNLWMLGKVAIYMANFAIRANPPISKIKKYLNGCALDILAKYYEISIVIVHSKEFDNRLSIFDQDLKKTMPMFYSKLEDKLVSRHIGFHYLKAWRVKCNSRTIPFALFRVYRRLLRVLFRTNGGDWL